MNWYFQLLSKYAELMVAYDEANIGFVLFNILIVYFIGAGNSAFGALCIIYSSGILIPSLAVVVRRLHDTWRSGWNAGINTSYWRHYPTHLYGSRQCG